jgi:ABC-type transport system substrate-binding protein
MKFKEWVRDDRIVLEKFPGHWEKGLDGQPLPYVDGLVSRMITDQSVAFIELRSGNIDTFLDIDLKDVAPAKALPNLAVVSLPGQWRAFPGFYFNPRPGTPYPFSNHKKLREAAQYALDRESMAKALGFGLASPAYYYFWFPGMLGYDETLPKRGFDLARAKQLVQEAGFPSGVDVEVKVINRTIEVRSVEVMQAMLEKAGIRMKITPLDRLPWVNDGKAGRFDALSHSNSSRVDPQMTEDSKTGSLYNWAGYSNPEVDKLWNVAAGEYDDGKRAEAYKRIQRILYEDAYHVLGFKYPLVAAVSRRVQNLSAQHNFRYVWLD